MIRLERFKIPGANAPLILNRNGNYLVKLLAKPFIDVRLAGNPYREFATNAATAVQSASNIAGAMRSASWREPAGVRWTGVSVNCSGGMASQRSR